MYMSENSKGLDPIKLKLPLYVLKVYPPVSNVIYGFYIVAGASMEVSSNKIIIICMIWKASYS